MPLGEVDGSGLDGIAVAPCDPQGDDTAERQVIICRSGYKNQAMHLQVLDLPSSSAVAVALAWFHVDWVRLLTVRPSSRRCSHVSARRFAR